MLWSWIRDLGLDCEVGGHSSEVDVKKIFYIIDAEAWDFVPYFQSVRASTAPLRVDRSAGR